MSFIKPYTIIPLLVLMINTYTLGYVYALDRKNPLNRAYCYFTISSIAWVGITFFAYLPVDIAWSQLILKAATIGWLPTGFLIMNLTYASLNKKKDAIYRLTLALLVLFMAAGPFTDLIVAGYRRFSWGFWQSDGLLFLPAIAIIIVIPILYSLFLFSKRFYSIKSTEEQHHLIFLLAGPVLNLAVALLLELFIPRFVDSSVPRLSPSSTVISSLIIFYAIRKYHILSPDIRNMATGIFLTVRDGVILLNNRGDILRMNGTARELFQLKGDDSDAVTTRDLIDGYSVDRDYKDYEIETGSDGNRRTLLITQSAISNNGQQLGKVLTAKDITPIKKLLSDVQRSEERFRFLVEDITETIFSIQTNGIIDYISPVIRTFTGWEPEELIGTHFQTYIHPDDLVKVKKRFAESLSGIPGQQEFRVRAKDGTLRDVITSSKKIEHNGELYGIRGVMTNVTEYKKIKQELMDSQRIYRIIANSIIDKIWIYDLRELKVTYTSPAVLRLNGRTPEEELNTPPEERIEKGSLDRALAQLAEELEHDAVRDPDRKSIVEFTEKHKDGRWIQTEATITFLRDDTGRPMQVLGVSRDITERKNLEQELVTSFSELKRRNDLIEKDLATARITHQKLLPSSLPIMNQFRIDFRYLPLEAVGGDYFNFIDLKEGGLGVFIGDVTGHGVSAALFLSLVKSITNILLRDHALDPGDFLYHLNNELYRHMHSYFITAIYGLFRQVEDSDTIRFTFANGGHPPPLIYCAEEGTAETLYARGTAIGAFEQSRFSVSDITVRKGDRIYLYTDGLVEVLNEEGQLLGFDTLPGIVTRSYDRNLPETLDSIIKEIHRFRGKTPLDDDIVLLGIEVT